MCSPLCVIYDALEMTVIITIIISTKMSMIKVYYLI